MANSTAPRAGPNKLFFPPIGSTSALLENLTEEDVSWLLQNGSEHYFNEKTPVIKEGDLITSLYVVLEGLLGVFISTLGQKQLASIGSGEIMGDMSFIEEKPTSASIIAVETSRVLIIPQDVLKKKITNDPVFAARFYRALCLSISQRLRRSIDHLGIYTQKATTEETETETWQKMASAIQDFKNLMYKADQEALENNDVVPEEISSNMLIFFKEFMHFLNSTLGDNSPENIYVKEKIGLRLQQEMLPYLLLTNTAERFYSKPRGYPSDFISIEMIYKNSPSGSGRIGPHLDWCFLNQPPCVTLRNRRNFIADEIYNYLERHPGGEYHVTSIVSGPADELFDVYKKQDDQAVLKSTLIDFDSQALNYIKNIRNKLNLQEQMDLLNFEMGHDKVHILPQDFIYSIILPDYLNDKMFIRLLNIIHGMLNEGGKVIVSNLHPNNPAKAFMEYVLEWKVNHRTEEDLNRMFSNSAFGAPCTEMYFDKQNICLFAEAVK